MTDQKIRLRIVFAKKEAVKYIGHLDLMLAWERALRRARIPLAYSQGFNPRPKMQAASSLPLGSIGTAEILDIIVTEPLDLSAARERISQALPTGIAVQTIAEVSLKGPALQQLLRQADYTVTVETELSAETLTERIQALSAAPEIWQTRRRKRRQERFNLRPLIHQLHLQSVENGEAVLMMRLSAGQFGNLRPQDLLKALELADSWFMVARTQLIFEE